MKSQNPKSRNRRSIIKLIVLAIFVSTIFYEPLGVVYSAGYSDDFNDGMQGWFWQFGVLRRSSSEFDSAVKVTEQNGRLEITPLSGLAGDHYNGYVSLTPLDMTGGRATVEVIQVASGKATTVFSVGINNYDCYSFRAKGTSLHFDKKVGGTISTVTIPFSATNHRFWRIRHDQAVDSMVFETSADQTAWTVGRTVPREMSITAIRSELNAGTSEIVSLPGTAMFDNFQLETTLTPEPSPTPTPEATPTATPTPTPTPASTPTPTATPTPTPTATPTPTPTATPTPTPNPSPNPGSCLDGSGPLITLSGDYISLYRNTSLAASTRIDARFARWIHAGVVPFRIGGGAGVCVEGGEIIGNYALSTSWDVMHDTYAMMIRGGLNYLLSEIRIHNYGDGIYIGSENNDGFIVRGAYLSQIRDDAFQNDNGKPGVVEDCLVDGAYVGFSDQKYTVASTDSVWEIRDTLVRLQVYEQTYVAGKSGHGWFWKWDTDGIKLSMHGNIFYAEAASIHGSHKLLPEKVVSCKKSDGSPDNIIVWGGTGPYPRPEELLTGCFTLTTDRGIWDEAVTNWKLRHNR